jgi:hypothetical protein
MRGTRSGTVASGADLARLLDDLDRQLRGALPKIGEVFIDVTAHRRMPDAP